SRLSKRRGPAAVSRIALLFLQQQSQPGQNARTVAPPETYGVDRLLLIEPVDGMQSPDGKFSVRAVDQNGNLDFRRRDRTNIDALLGERPECRRGNAGMAAHADADHRDLGHAFVMLHSIKTDVLTSLLQCRQRLRNVA